MQEIVSQSCPTLCLNMIVKNESDIILRFLHSVLPLIDSYCICDTGSTDNTVEMITSFFQPLTHISGKIIYEPFRDFGYNRTYALQQCQSISQKADYILLMDADMILQFNITPIEIKQRLIQHHAYYIYQGTDTFYYKNMRIVKNYEENVSYWGVTHEYVNCPSYFTNTIFDKQELFILDIGDGGSKQDKYTRDIALLQKGLEEYPNNDRYTFYLANSYRDNKEYDHAIDTYKKRIDIGGWFEEVWYCYYSIGSCYSIKGDMIHAIYYWLEGYNFFPHRIENIYEIITYYRQQQKYKLAYQFFLIAEKERNKLKQFDYLFLKKDIYDYKLDYELSIMGYYCQEETPHLQLIQTCMKIFAYPHLENVVFKNVLSNYKFYATCLQDKHQLDFNETNIIMLQQIGQTLLQEEIQTNDFVSSTPSLCINPINPTEMIINIRYVNYKINHDNGEYENKEYIVSKNVIAIIDISSKIWQKKNEYILQYNTSSDCKYIGLEDIRLYWNNVTNQYYFNANRGISNGNMVVEHGYIQQQQTHSHLLKIKNQYNIEKNWVLFEDCIHHTTKIIYKWSPLTIGEIHDNHEFIVETKQTTPYFFSHLRGSSNGILIENEIWFLCHMVSYEDRRYYYHLFVVLDSHTFALKKYTSLFTFTKAKVEYSLGFIYNSLIGQFFIGYSILDCSTEFMAITKHSMEKMMILI